MATYSLVDATGLSKAIGRAAVFYGSTFTYVASPTGADLSLTYLGDTEGDITIDTNETYSDLTFPELTGPAIHQRKLLGFNPVVNLPLFVADPAIRAIVSPTGTGNAGYTRPRSVTQHVLALIPEAVFINGSNAEVSINFTNTTGTGAWTVGGVSATTAQLALLDQSVWFWGGHFTKSTPAYKQTDDGKLNQGVHFQNMVNSSMPDGYQLFTIGRPDQLATPVLIDAA